MNDFDFETWHNLAKNDPEEFEKAKSDLIESTIKSMTKDKDVQQRLRAMMFNVNNELDRKFKDPTARFNEVQRRFWAQVNEFKDAAAKSELPPKIKAEILNFKKPTD